MLNQEDKARLPSELLFQLFVEGFVGLNEAEIAGFNATQLEYVRNLGTTYAEELVSTWLATIAVQSVEDVLSESFFEGYNHKTGDEHTPLG